MLVVACCVGGVTHWVSSEHGLVVPKVVQLLYSYLFYILLSPFAKPAKKCVFLYHLLLPIVVFPVTVRNRDFDMDSLL